VGKWRGNITIPDGDEGVPAMVVLLFSESGQIVTVKGSANNKPLAIQNAMATCRDFSFAPPQANLTVVFSGKLSDDGQNIGGTATRRDFKTS
jgi:hypothetical protein